MFDALNTMLKDLMQSRVPALAGATSVGFEPPGEDWKRALSNETRLNLYLYDIHENRKLRTNERERVRLGSMFTERPAPPRINCTYMATVWSGMTFNLPAAEPTRAEHMVMSRVLTVLLARSALSPTEIYSGVPIPSGNDINAIPAALRGEALPLEVVMPDALKEAMEFWSSMKAPLRPALHITITVPFFPDLPARESPAITTLTTQHRMAGVVQAAERLITIAGEVQVADASSVFGAWVQLRGLAPADVSGIERLAVTDTNGRYVFDALPAGRYRLRAVSAGVGDVQREIDVPSDSGEYDLQFP
ncbi:Pvc16 family protein [Microvirga massiliensis]|uniref:Pvc16 family protein n=1 Tax=Microvirga massiliensis TaxID=1033741 RepID=UPI00062B6D27|nr:Pvc16 family protein [Microvirga massiliensis]